MAVSTTGDHFHDIIKTYTGEDYKPGCSCKAMVAEMNNHPPQWSLKNEKRIIGKVQREATRRHWWAKWVLSLPGTKTPIYWMLCEAVRLAELDLENAKKATEQTSGE